MLPCRIRYSFLILFGVTQNFYAQASQKVRRYFVPAAVGNRTSIGVNSFVQDRPQECTGASNYGHAKLLLCVKVNIH